MRKFLGIITISVIIFSLSPALTYATPLPNRVVKYNERSEDVKNIQTALNSKGYNIKVDGVYGPGTKAAISNFQSKFSQLTSDGIYGPKTKAILEGNLSPNRSAPISNSNTLILVNKSNYLSKNHVPNDLRKVNLPSAAGKDQLRNISATALESMFKDAKKDGHTLFAQSGYRSYQRQTDIFNSNVSKYGRAKAETFSAPPGSSEHQTGLAMDLSSKGTGYALVEKFATLPEGKWIAKNSWKYGFIIRYPKDKTHITKYTYEPWHVRYVGKDAAKGIYERALALEEYLGK